MLKTKNQPHLRVVTREGRFEDPRTYAQSTPGQSDSQVTSPLDSRSISTASDSPQGFTPYATFIKCPREVPQRSAKARRSSTDRCLRNSSNVMVPDYHHTVISKATPFREFTGQCARRDNPSMDIKELPEIRRTNLRRFVDTRMRGNLSALARTYRPDNPRPNFFSDLLRGAKNFGEKLAFELETCTGLKYGQLSIKDSPLEMREVVRETTSEDILEGLTPSERQEALRLIADIKGRRKARKRA